MSVFELNPLELKLVKFTPEVIRALRPTSTGQIFEQGKTFHPDGLFSVMTFGRVGTEVRSSHFSRIELNIEIMQPIIYKNVLDLGSIYGKVMEGKVMCVFDKDIGDFIPSDDPRAKTGFNFFMSNFKHIKFRQTDSEKRSKAIEMVTKALERGDATCNQLIVMPAGIRDYIEKPDGRPEEDEINGLYRTVISRASMIDPQRGQESPELYDDAALGVQKAVYEIYMYIFSLINGKKKLLQDKWFSRKTFNTTFNVGSSYVERTQELDDPRRLKLNESRVGLYQFLRSAAPITIYHIRNKYIPDIFPDGSNIAYLTNTKTWKQEEVVIRGIQKQVSLWTSPEGIEKAMASIGNQDIRNTPIYLGSNNEHCIGLLYNDGKRFKFFQDIDELPEGFDRKYVKPITIFEFLYICVYDMSGRFPGLITRYPVTGYGSIYPSIIKLATTIDTTIACELDINWEKGDPSRTTAINMPIMDSGYVNTFSLHNSHLPTTGGDFDGDTFHLKMLLSREARAEVDSVLKRKDYYTNDKGEAFFSVVSDILDATLRAMC